MESHHLNETDQGAKPAPTLRGKEAERKEIEPKEPKRVKSEQVKEEERLLSRFARKWRRFALALIQQREDVEGRQKEGVRITSRKIQEEAVTHQGAALKSIQT